MQIGESDFGEHVGKYEQVLYLAHRNADPDAIGSAFALQQAFGGSLGAVDDLSRTGQALAGIIGAQVLINPTTKDYDLVVVVDTSVRLQLGDTPLAKYALVDHHQDTGMLHDALFFIQKPAKSTAEIVWTILRENGKTASRNMVLGLLVGMISDTGRFKRATPSTFRTAAELLEAGGFDYEEAQSALSVPADISQRIASLKAASRAKIERKGPWLIATTEINSFEGSAAMALVELGADVAFAAGRHGNLVRISSRAGRDAARAGLDLAEIMRGIAEVHGGEGGGHKAAAALEARAKPAALLDLCAKRTADSLP
ncbi:manganese-dependent inorganic pyrophosphatase [uncultured archaeon]|nr:manganese-dependent inorganic pyrophosphatase [uncultured archaeon]